MTREDREPAVFIVHGLDHLRAALAAGRDSGRRIVAVSAPGASAFAGEAWFAALAAEGRTAFPDVAFTAILDCGDRAGDAVMALKAGANPVIFTGAALAAARLSALASTLGAGVIDRRPDGVDLGMVADPAWTARRICFAGA